MESTGDLLLKISADIAAARRALDRLEVQVKDYGTVDADKPTDTKHDRTDRRGGRHRRDG